MSEPITARFVEIRGDDNRLLFKFDPNRLLIQIKPRNGRLQTVDLTQYRQEAVGKIEKVARVKGLGRLTNR